MQFSSDDMADREGSEGSVAMEEDQDDDLYGANGARRNGQQVADANIQDGEEDDEEEEDSDDVRFILISWSNIR